MKMFDFLLSEEAKIKREIRARAMTIAAEHYRKELMMRQFRSSDLSHAIMLDLMKAAQMTGKVTVELKDGTKIVIENDPRGQLEKLDTLF